jgi:uncharacterized coiled-coil protein SlyX
MGIRNKIILTERVRKLEEKVADQDKHIESAVGILRRMQDQQDRMLKILGDLTDKEAYHKWLKEQEKEKVT